MNMKYFPLMQALCFFKLSSVLAEPIFQYKIIEWAGTYSNEDFKTSLTQAGKGQLGFDIVVVDSY